MCFPNYNTPNDSHTQGNEHFEERVMCKRCFRTISEFRPPVYNPDNCSCVEVGRSTAGNAATAHVFEPQLYQYNIGIAADLQLHQAQSYASSVPCPEGPEHEAPTVAVTSSNSFLEVAPALGHNEDAHRRSSSFRSNMSYPLRCYLIEQANMPQEDTDRFLPQEVHIQSKTSMQVNQSSVRSKPSWQSGSERLEREIFPGFDVDPLTHAGAWAMEESGLRRWEGGAYPTFMGEMYYRDFTA